MQRRTSRAGQRPATPASASSASCCAARPARALAAGSVSARRCAPRGRAATAGAPRCTCSGSGRNSKNTLGPVSSSSTAVTSTLLRARETARANSRSSSCMAARRRSRVETASASTRVAASASRQVSRSAAAQPGVRPDALLHAGDHDRVEFGAERSGGREHPHRLPARGRVEPVFGDIAVEDAAHEHAGIGIERALDESLGGLEQGDDRIQVAVGLIRERSVTAREFGPRGAPARCGPRPSTAARAPWRPARARRARTARVRARTAARRASRVSIRSNSSGWRIAETSSSRPDRSPPPASSRCRSAERRRRSSTGSRRPPVPTRAPATSSKRPVLPRGRDRSRRRRSRTGAQGSEGPAWTARRGWAPRAPPALPRERRPDVCRGRSPRTATTRRRRGRAARAADARSRRTPRRLTQGERAHGRIRLAHRSAPARCATTPTAPMRCVICADQSLCHAVPRCARGEHGRCCRGCAPAGRNSRASHRGRRPSRRRGHRRRSPRSPVRGTASRSSTPPRVSSCASSTRITPDAVDDLGAARCGAQEHRRLRAPDPRHRDAHRACRRAPAGTRRQNAASASHTGSSARSPRSAAAPGSIPSVVHSARNARSSVRNPWSNGPWTAATAGQRLGARSLRLRRRPRAGPGSSWSSSPPVSSCGGSSPRRHLAPRTSWKANEATERASGPAVAAPDREGEPVAQRRRRLTRGVSTSSCVRVDIRLLDQGARRARRAPWSCRSRERRPRPPDADDGRPTTAACCGVQHASPRRRRCRRSPCASTLARSADTAAFAESVPRTAGGARGRVS